VNSHNLEYLVNVEICRECNGYYGENDLSWLFPEETEPTTTCLRCNSFIKIPKPKNTY
jgi:ribosomal protein L40E